MKNETLKNIAVIEIDYNGYNFGGEWQECDHEAFELWLENNAPKLLEPYFPNADIFVNANIDYKTGGLGDSVKIFDLSLLRCTDNFEVKYEYQEQAQKIIDNINFFEIWANNY